MGTLTGTPRFVLLVRSAGKGQYHGEVVGTDIVVTATASPFIAAAQALVERGAPPTAILVMRWDGADHDALTGPLGAAAAQRARTGDALAEAA